MIVAQKYLNIMNEAIGYFEVARWVNVLSQNGQFRGSNHLFLGRAKIKYWLTSPLPRLKIIKRSYSAIMYNTVDPDYVHTTLDEL